MPYHLRIKICGVTTEADAQQAALLGADAIGLNFYSGSPRCIDPARARSIMRSLPPFLEAVGVFVEQPLQQVFEQVHPLGRIRTIQWHGQHRQVSDCYPYHFIPAFPVRDTDSLQAITRYLE